MSAELCQCCHRPLPPVAEICRCGETRTMHNIETKAMPCAVIGCPCKRYVPAEVPA